MNILVVNTGSSTLKFQLIDTETWTPLAKGLCDRIGTKQSVLQYLRFGHAALTLERNMPGHREAIWAIMDMLCDRQYGVITGTDDIAAVGHRVVHAGEKFNGSVVIDDAIVQALKECVDFAPMHNAANITGIEVLRELLPDIPMMGVFDTAFHQTLPRYAFLYALPYELYAKHGLRKYGFHGTSHKYVSQRAAVLLSKPLEELKIVSCHLGNGASVCAVKNGQSAETSMGFTPLDGLAMGTRCGAVDPYTVKFVMEKEKMTVEEVDGMLNKASGLTGICGMSDFRDIEAAAAAGDERCRIAIEIFCYRVRKTIGEYAAVMGGLDAVIFTGGIGENAPEVRAKATEGLEFLGILMDDCRNLMGRTDSDISAPDARVHILVVHTDEEIAIAEETHRLLKSLWQLTPI